MKNLYKLFIFCTIVFFSGTLFTSAYFAKFIINIPNPAISLASVESTVLDVSITLENTYDYEEGEFRYTIMRQDICNEYNEDWDCIDQVPNLCPYISISPKNEESTEIGFSKNPPNFSFYARGDLSSPNDLVDNWEVTITSPCFEGECPSDYNSNLNGAPLDQSHKGQTFKCNIIVESSEPPPLVKKFFGNSLAYAQLSSLNRVEISAILTGEYTPEPTGNSSVLFLPGLMASRLYNSSEQLWEPGNNSDVEALYMNESGESIDPNIYVGEIIKETNVPVNLGFAGQNIYKSFSNKMDDLVSLGVINEWQSYAYDWREDVFDILENGTKYEDETKYLEDVLEDLVINSDSGKATIVAHSNGGILAKALLKKLQDDKNAGRNNLIDKVDVLILVAVPQIGTGKTVPSMLHGYDQKLLGGNLMNEIHARQLGKNMPSAYGLLPSREYINRVSASPVSFKTGVVTDIFTGAYGNVVDSYAEYKDFIFGVEGIENPSVDNTDYPIKLLSSLFNKAEQLHDQIDQWIPPESMRVIEVAGWGLDTVAGFNYYSKFTGCKNTELNCKDGYILDARPVFTIDGDETVVVPTAHYMEGQNIEQYWVDLRKYNKFFSFNFNRDHKDIFEVNSVNNLLESILKQVNIDIDSYLKNEVPLYEGNRLRISIHSPVKIGAYDSQGNFTGKICRDDSDFCYVEESIINSSYLEFGEGKYINLPEEELNKVILEGADLGVFTFEIEKVLENQSIENYYFKNIPVTSEMKGEFVINQSNEPELKIDVSGDGIYDFTISPNDQFNPILYLQIFKETIKNLDIKQNRKNNFIKRIDRMINLINRGKINKAELRMEKFSSVLEKRLDKKDPKKPKSGRLTKQQAEELLIMLENLLNNLEK